MREKCVKCGQIVPWMVLCGNAVMMFFQLYIGYVSGSKGLVADGIHSGTDVVCTLMVIITMGFSNRKSDKSHPWGYGKAESLGAVLAYVALVCIAAMILIDALGAIITGDLRPPQWVAFFAAFAAIIANYILSGYGFCAGKKLNSPALIANATENRSDMLSSIAVCIGVFFANIGFAKLDAVAAIVVGLMIGKSGLELGMQALKSLIDESLPGEKSELIKKTVLQYKEVRGVNYINARRIGQSAWIDMEIFIDSKLTVKQGYAVVREVRQALMRRFTHIKDVSISFNCRENAPAASSS